MKALPVRLESGKYVRCSVADATHLTVNIPGPSGQKTLPVILHGSRKEIFAWTWNGSVEAPTLRPSVLTKGYAFTCHSWVNDGKAQFLPDSTHEFAGKNVELLEVAEDSFNQPEKLNPD